MVQLDVGSATGAVPCAACAQLAPHAEAKFIRCTRGAIYDVIIDLPEGSPTFGRCDSLELAA